MRDVIMKINCKDDKEVESVTREIQKFNRRISHIKGKQLNYEAVTINLQNGKARVIRNRKNPREASL